MLPQCGAALVLDFVAFLASLLTGRYRAPHQVLHHLMSSIAAGVAVVSLAPLYAGIHNPAPHTPRPTQWGAAGAGEGAPGASSHVVVEQEDGMLLLAAPAPVVPHGGSGGCGWPHGRSWLGSDGLATSSTPILSSGQS